MCTHKFDFRMGLFEYFTSDSPIDKLNKNNNKKKQTRGKVRIKIFRIDLVDFVPKVYSFISK